MRNPSNTIISLARTAAAIAAIAGLAGALGGCGNRAKSDAEESQESKALLRPSPVKRNAQAEELNKEATDLQELFNSQKAAESAEFVPPSPPRSSRTIPAEPVADVPETNRATANAALEVPEAMAVVKEPKPSKSLAQKREDAISALAELLTPEISAAKEPLRAAIPLMALDTLTPGAGASHLDSISRAVTPDQRQSLRSTQELIRSLATNPVLASGDRGAIARAFRDAADELSSVGSSDSVAFGGVALCRRVEGFGRYTPIETSTFVVGRPISFIVYAEVQNFTLTRMTPANESEPGGWQVELGQSIRLHLDSDGTEQFVVPEQTVKDVARTARRDFYVVQRVDLPRTLSVGQYNLKVQVRDMASGAIAEQILPIRLVADPSAARSEAR